KYVSNNPSDARNHFYGLKEAVPELKGIAIYDRLDKDLQQTELKEIMWKRREIENYLPIPDVIERYLQQQPVDLFSRHDISRMKTLINDYIPPAAVKDRSESWWNDVKMSNDFLDKVFGKYFEKVRMPVLLDKGNYYELALLAKPEELDSEIKEKLDAIHEVIEKA
ncbi:MAG: hypothetical protein V1764_03050, partial [Nitrospirota bacterium]